MRCSPIDYGIFIIAVFLIWFFFHQQAELTYAEETIRLQHEAILKQNQYLEAQKRYIESLEQDSLPPRHYQHPQLLYDGRGI